MRRKVLHVGIMVSWYMLVCWYAHTSCCGFGTKVQTIYFIMVDAWACTVGMWMHTEFIELKVGQLGSQQPQQETLVKTVVLPSVT